MSSVTREQYLKSDNKGWDVFECGNNYFANQTAAEIEKHIYLYLLYKVMQLENPEKYNLKTILNCKELEISESARTLIKSTVTAQQWSSILRGCINQSEKKQLFPEQFAFHSILMNLSSNSTPWGIVNLANKILDIKPNEEVADIGCGIGVFIIDSWQKEDKAKYYGYEYNAEYSNVAAIRSELVEGDIKISGQDAFSLVDDINFKKYDKIFSNYPLKIPLNELGKSGEKFLNELLGKIPSLSKATSSDWIYNALLCDLLKDNGKAVGIMTNGSLWNRTDKLMRQYFVENGFVEAVIALPERVFRDTYIPTSLIVLSKGNKNVKLVDASKICQKERRYTTLEDDDINKIIEILHSDSEGSKTVSLEELRENDYILNLTRYLNYEVLFKNPVEFESVILNIRRGTNIKAEDLDKISTNEITNINYLMLGNIHDGIIDEELPFLSNIDEKFNKYCLKTNNLILSKNGEPAKLQNNENLFKTAVVNLKEEQIILGVGNLYIIELDENKINPYYLKAFFESEKGVAVLKSIVTGSSIPSIGIENLKKIKIPCPPIEVQNKIAQKYQAAQDSVKALRFRLEKNINQLYHIFDEEDFA